jgi:orotate phosphoribosyltransferase
MDTTTFVDFLVASEVLRFGDFTTKSGRSTPYFLDFGHLGSARELDTVGRAYADHVLATFGDGVDLLFGPAYKGIPLVVATAVSLHRDHGLDVGWAFNRKEAKDHGEGGVLVGRTPRPGDRVVIIEDVTTAGTSIRETVPILRAAADVVVAGLVVSVDRRERGSRPDMTALDEVGAEFDMRTSAIATIDQVVEVLTDPDRVTGRLSDDDLRRLAAYRRRWGVN